MRFLRFLGLWLRELLKILTYRWIVDLFGILVRFCKALKGFFAFVRQPHAEQEDTEEDCHKIHNPAFHRPDPCIYSQPYLLQLGLPVTWDNPDIVIKRGGVPVVETALLPNTDYDIEATVWNNSYDAPVVGLKVHFSYLSFGVATDVHPIGTTLVNLGVKGGANHPALATMPWTTPPTPGHYCLQVLLEWIDDFNPGNNLGQNNLDVIQATSPATFTFVLKNQTGKPNRFRFEVDTYTIPDLPECTPGGPILERTRAERLPQIKARHNRENFPVPAGWNVEINPQEASLDVDEEVVMVVVITPPDSFHGQQPFNVNARHDSTYAGGVSLVVSKP